MRHAGGSNAALERLQKNCWILRRRKPGPPSADGKLSGTVNFMALHETYHVGQVAYVRSFLGHAGVMG